MRVTVDVKEDAMRSDRSARWTTRMVRAAWLGLVIWAVVQELRRPPGERTWHGELAGIVPYDLRPPTVARARERLWSPENPHLVVPQVFGVGWTLNLGRLVSLVRPRRTQSQ
jgi:Family of unknown function (DUF5808)